MVKKDKIDWRGYFLPGRKQKSPLDLEQLFPGYFNKNVFRSMIFLMVVLLVFTLWTNDWRMHYSYVECPADVLTRCEFINGTVEDIYNWEEVRLKTIYLMPGEVLGVKPNEHFENFKGRVILLCFLGFLINHLFYFKKSGSWKIPLNKANWNKVKKSFKDGFEEVNKDERD